MNIEGVIFTVYGVSFSRGLYGRRTATAGWVNIGLKFAIFSRRQVNEPAEINDESMPILSGDPFFTRAISLGLERGVGD